MLIQPRLNGRYDVVAGDTLWNLVEGDYGDYGDDRTLTLVKMVAAANFINDVVGVGQGSTSVVRPGRLTAKASATLG